MFWKFYGLMRSGLTSTKVWRKKESAHDPKHMSSSVKHGGGSVMAWACMALPGVGSLIFIDDVTCDGCSRMNSKVYKNILPANLRRNVSKLIGRNLHASKIMTQKRTSLGEEVIGWKTPPKQKTSERGCRKSLEKHHKEECNSLVMALQASCSYCKQGICFQILSVIYFYLLKQKF